MRPAVRRLFWWVGLVTLVALVTWLMSGCAMLPKGRIKANGVTVQSPKDGNNANLTQENATGVLTLPAGSKVTTVKWEAVAWQPAINGRPEVQAQPAREETTVVLSADATWQKDERKIAANTGTIDTTVAMRRIDIESAKPLLYASIIAAIIAAVFVYIKYPTPALIFGGVSVIFFLAWKVSGLPSWFWVIGVFGAGAGLFLWFGHRRGENDGVKAALAGDIETKATPSVKS